MHWSVLLISNRHFGSDFNLNNRDPLWFIFQLSDSNCRGNQRDIQNSKPGSHSYAKKRKKWPNEDLEEVELLMMEEVHCSCIAWTKIQCSVSAMHPLLPSHHPWKLHHPPQHIIPHHPLHAMIIIIFHLTFSPLLSIHVISNLEPKPPYLKSGWEAYLQEQ